MYKMSGYSLDDLVFVSNDVYIGDTKMTTIFDIKSFVGDHLKIGKQYAGKYQCIFKNYKRDETVILLVNKYDVKLLYSTVSLLRYEPDRYILTFRPVGKLNEWVDKFRSFCVDEPVLSQLVKTINDPSEFRYVGDTELDDDLFLFKHPVENIMVAFIIFSEQGKELKEFRSFYSMFKNHRIDMSDVVNQTFVEGTLGDRMKKYEMDSLNNIMVMPYESYVVRLDGNGFSKFTKVLKNGVEPFDIGFSAVMVNTMNDMVKKFNAKTGYTHSDEISLVFPSLYRSLEECEKAGPRGKKHMHGGRTCKLVSLMAAYCSVRFNHHWAALLQVEPDMYKKETKEKLLSNMAIFDARVIVFDESRRDDVVNLLYWRSARDSYRTAVFQYARTMFSQSELEGKHSGEMIELMREKGLDWEKDVPIFWKYGVYCKRSSTNMDKLRRYENRSFKIAWSPEMVELIYGDEWVQFPSMEYIVVLNKWMVCCQDQQVHDAIIKSKNEGYFTKANAQ